MKSRKPGISQLIGEDLRRLAQPSLRSFLKWYFLPRGATFPYTVWLRVVSCLRRGGFFAKILATLAYPILRHYEFKYGIHGNPNIEIGPGFLVVHGGGVYLNCVRIGSNFTVYQGVTLGVNKGAIPVVEEDVTIYPNAVVVGGIRVGAGAKIGALSYVDKDVAPNAVVVGAPAHEVEITP